MHSGGDYMKVDWQLESKWGDKLWACMPLIMCLFMVWAGGKKSTAEAAKGLPTRLVIWKHAFKNASIPVFTLFFVTFAALISGAVVTETIFAWPGMGRLLWIR